MVVVGADVHKRTHTFVAVDEAARELGDDIRERIEMIETQHDKNIHLLYVAQRKLRAGLVTRRRLLREFEAKVRDLEDKITKITLAN